MMKMNAGVPSKLTSNVAAWKAFFAERWTEASVACRFAHCAVRLQKVAQPSPGKCGSGANGLFK